MAERETAVADGAADPLADIRTNVDEIICAVLAAAEADLPNSEIRYAVDLVMAAVRPVAAALDAERAETERLRARLAGYEATDGTAIPGDLVARFRDLKARAAALETETPA